MNIGTLFAFAMVSLGVVFLRSDRKFRNLPKSFEVPLYPFIPILSFAACVYLMLQLAPFTWKMFGIWLVIGLVIYFSYGFSHSIARRNEEKSVDKHG